VRRRTFVQAFGCALAGASLPARRWPGRHHLARVGLELYSVRDAMRKDPEGTLAAVRAMGYADVELLWTFDNFGRTPQQVRTTLDREGLRAPSAHIAPETLLTDWSRSLDIARMVGHDYLIVPSLPAETDRSLDQWRVWADHFNAAGTAARRAGLWLAFHNEPGHMKAIDGTVPYDVFLARTDPAVVRLQLDVGNMAIGGGNPAHYLEKYRDRYWSFHLKDVTADGTHDTELGTGRLELRKLLAAIPEVDRKPCYVEQEAAGDPLASARRNCAFLRELEF
jgi:sugar phosphate isomerase/epimerase